MSLKIDTIGELTADNGVSIDSVALKDGQITLTGDPTTNLMTATKQYVDNVVNGLSWIESCRVASTANIDLATGGLLTIDLIGPLTVGDRVLVKNQTISTQDGIYNVVDGTWTRSTDTDALDEFANKTLHVTEGSTQGDTEWTCTSDTVNPGVTSPTIVQRATSRNHNLMTTLQGGNGSDEYYHLNSAEHTELSAWLDDVTLGASGSLTIPAGQTLSVDTINEITGANGVSIDSVSLKDGGVTATGTVHVDSAGDSNIHLDKGAVGDDTYLQFQIAGVYQWQFRHGASDTSLKVQHTSGGTVATFGADSSTTFGSGGIKTDNIDEASGGSGVTIDSVILKDNGVTANTYNFGNGTATRLLALDGSKNLTSVSDLTSWIAGTANEVTVTDDADGTLTLSLPLEIHVDTINESTGATGITIDGVLLKDNNISTTGSLSIDTINEKNSDTGVTIESIRMENIGSNTIEVDIPSGFHYSFCVNGSEIMQLTA